MQSMDHERDEPRAFAGVSRRATLRRLGLGGIAAGAAFGLGRQSTGAQSGMTSAATEAATRRTLSSLNQALATGDMTVLDSTFAVDYVNNTPRTSLLTGKPYSPDLAGLKSALADLRVIAPNMVIVVDDIVASGDTAAIRATARGTLDTGVVSIPADASPRLRIGGAAFARVEDGLVIESWAYDEAAGLYAIAPSAPAQPAEEPVADDRAATRDVSGFERVSLQGIGTLVITQGETESLTIEAEPRVLRRIASEVQDGTLVIRPDQSIRAREPITYSLSVDDLTGIELSGAGQVQAQSLETPQLNLALSGAGAVTIANLIAETLDVQASGNVIVTIGGSVDSQTVSFSQAGTYDARNLTSRMASVSVDGAAQAAVNVSETLNATASGASSITYVGSPDVSESTSGVGSVTPAG